MYVLAVLAAVTVWLMTVAIFRPNYAPAMKRRIEHLHEPEEQDPYDAPFWERLIQPALMRVLSVVTALMPTRIMAAMDSLLERAGRPMTLNRFLALSLVAGAGLPVPLLLLAAASGDMQPAFVAVLAGAGFAALFLPWLLVRRRANKRSRAIDRALPDATDLVVTNVEAGIGLQMALQEVADRMEGPIAEEFARVVREVSLGRPRDEALAEMAQRSGAPDMRQFASAVAQAELTGIPVARVLRNHSIESRERRRQKAHEQANKIPVKMTIPTVFFIFPTLFLLLMGPVALNIIDYF